MENQGQDITGKLNHLIALAEDGKHGYENAARDIKDSTLESMFLRFSSQRASYVAQLQQQVSQLGEQPKDSGGPIGALHRTWIDIKAALTNGDKDAVIKECIAGEEYALKEYQTVLDEIKTDSSLRQILIGQRDGIQAAISTIKAHLNK